MLRERLALGVLVVCALLACKKKATKPVEPSLSPVAVLELAKGDAASFEGAAIRVTGKVVEVRPGGDAVPPFVDLEADGAKLAAGMQSYMCTRGTCFRDPPRLGEVATLKCSGTFLLARPVLAQCEQAK
jgi:hypothetical protein